MSRWIAMHCGEETEALVSQHPNAFLLLAQIARRAKWKDCPITKLKAGQAFIGDWASAGIPTEMAYRHAKKVLLDCQLATFQGTNKGTVATLANSTIFSVSEEANNGQGNSPGTDKQQASNGPTTTNHTDTQNTRRTLSTKTPFALTGASSAQSLKMSWSAGDGFSGIAESDRKEWEEAFPAVNIDRQLATAHAWLKSNPAKARKSNWRRFITSWLSRAQDRGGDTRAEHAAPAFKDVEEFARNAPMPIPQKCTESFFDDMQARRWTYKGQPCVEAEAWQAAFRLHVERWGEGNGSSGFQTGKYVSVWDTPNPLQPWEQ